jgi:hypothetical protein
MMWIKLMTGGLGRRSVEAIAAVIILAATSARGRLLMWSRRPKCVDSSYTSRPARYRQIKSRFNRALFETPRNRKPAAYDTGLRAVD